MLVAGFENCGQLGNSGASGGAELNSTAASPYFFYVPNFSNSSVSVFSMDPGSGNLSQVVGSPFAVGNHPSSAATDTTGQFLFISNSAGDNIQSFLINSANGTPIAIATISNPNGPYVLTADPIGKFIYSINSGSANCISGYTINYSSGVLSEMTNSPFACGGAGNYGTVDPTGHFIYAVADGGVVGFTINQSTGALTEIAGSPFSTGTNPHQLTIAPGGKFLYVTNNGSANLSGYTITPGTGALVAISGSPFASAGSPLGINIDPSGRFLYDTTAGGISAYTINSSTGALTQISGSPFYTTISAGGTTIDPTGQFVFVSNNGSPNVSGFTINQTTGALTELPNSPFSAPSPYFSKFAVIR